MNRVDDRVGFMQDKVMWGIIDVNDEIIGLSAKSMDWLAIDNV